MAPRAARGGGVVTRMVLAPHADDESYGCGGLLAKYPEQCVVVVVTSPTPDRHFEFQRAMDAVGGSSLRSEQLSFADGWAGGNMKQLVTELDALLVEYKPDELYLPFPSTHQDHRAVYEAGMIAARLSMDADHWMPGGVLVYDVPVYDLQLYPTDLRWNVFEALTAIQVQKKAAAVACYESELPKGPHPGQNSSVVAQARALGVARGVDYAEQYARIREVRL